MKGFPQKQFLDEQKTKYKALKALVQKKHEIRINFFKSNTCVVQKLDLDKKPNGEMDTVEDKIQLKKEGISNRKSSSGSQSIFLSKREQSSKRQQDLYEVIYRDGSKMASIGWHQQIPLKRNSNMSRTYRRRRRSNMRDYDTINEPPSQYHPHQNQNEARNGQLTINNLELSGFTNEQILKKGSKSLPKSLSSNQNRQFLKQPKVLTFIGESNVKHAQFMIPISQSIHGGVFSIRNHKINRKWKNLEYLDDNTESKSRLINPQQFQYKKDEKIVSTTKQGLNPQNKSTIQHPFLKQLKPSKNAQQNKHLPVRREIKSQFIRSRPKMVVIQNYKSRRNEEISCRPWSVFRNVEQKLEDGQSPKPTLCQISQE